MIRISTLARRALALVLLLGLAVPAAARATVPAGPAGSAPAALSAVVPVAAAGAAGAADSGPRVGAWAEDPAPSLPSPPSDFRGIPFGAEFKDVSGLTPVSAKVSDPQGRYKDVYFRQDEPLTYASADILSVTYAFREGRLFQVSMAVRGEDNLFIIKDALISKYGPGRQVGARYGWTWPDFSLVVSAESEDGVGGVVFTKER